MRVRPAALALAATGTLAAAAVAPAVEPRQPATSEQIVEYYDSGAYDADATAAVDRARAYLDQRAATARRPAVVLDVDDTSLSNYECLRQADFDRDLAGESCVMSGDLPAIAQTLTLFRHARANGIAVFFVSGRRERQRAVTTANLRSSGYRGVWSLRLRPNRQPRSLRAGWKARVRRTITRRGYQIVVNVGDQWSDLRGGYALKTFKLPNPMYTIPVA